MTLGEFFNDMSMVSSIAVYAATNFGDTSNYDAGRYFFCKSAYPDVHNYFSPEIPKDWMDREIIQMYPEVPAKDMFSWISNGCRGEYPQPVLKISVEIGDDDNEFWDEIEDEWNDDSPEQALLDTCTSMQEYLSSHPLPSWYHHLTKESLITLLKIKSEYWGFSFNSAIALIYQNGINYLSDFSDDLDEFQKEIRKIAEKQNDDDEAEELDEDKEPDEGEDGDEDSIGSSKTIHIRISVDYIVEYNVAAKKNNRCMRKVPNVGIG